jgi:hypothetical protein
MTVDGNILRAVMGEPVGSIVKPEDQLADG